MKQKSILNVVNTIKRSQEARNRISEQTERGVDEGRWDGENGALRARQKCLYFI